MFTKLPSYELAMRDNTHCFAPWLGFHPGSNPVIAITKQDLSCARFHQSRCGRKLILVWKSRFCKNPTRGHGRYKLLCGLYLQEVRQSAAGGPAKAKLVQSHCWSWSQVLQAGCSR